MSSLSMIDVVGPNDGSAGIEASLDVEYMSVMGAGMKECSMQRTNDILLSHAICIFGCYVFTNIKRKGK